MILLIAGFMLSINGKPANMIEKEIFGFWGLMAILWVIFTVIGSFRLILERISIKYVVTDKRLITRLGILSENFKSATFKHVTSINTKQGLFGKIFNYGNIIINTSGTGTGVAFIWVNAKDPVKIKNMIEKHID